MNTFINHALLTLSLHKGLALLVSAFITSAAVICVAAAAAMALQHRSARSRSAVWRLGVMALLIVGVWRLMPDLSPPVAVMEWQVDLTPALQLETTVVELPLFELPQKSVWEKITDGFDRWAVCFWLGMAALWICLRVVGVLFGLRSLKRRCSAASRLTQEIGTEAGLPYGTAYRCVSELTSPMLTGWRKPVIWLPTESASWDESRLGAVLRHEAAHWQRGDWLWQWLAQAVLCLWWWQPLAWLARKQLRIETEHAADDLAVSGAEHAPEYARTLVEIAAGLPSPKSSLGISMFGNDGVKQRVQALIKTNRWRGRIGMGALSVLTVVVVLLAVLAATKVEFVPQQSVYRSTAKLVAVVAVVAVGKMETNEALKWQEHLQHFYGTIIETLESAEMQRRAVERVRVLNPGLADHKVEVHASQTKDSAIIQVMGTGDDAKYARIYLDALLDEFIAFRQSVREQVQGKVLKTFMEQTAKKQKEMEIQMQALETFQRENNLLVVTNGYNKAAQLLGALQLQREQLRTEMMDLELAGTNISAFYQSQGRALERNLSEMDQIYLKTQAEIFVLKNDRDYLMKNHKVDHPEVAASMKK